MIITFKTWIAAAETDELTRRRRFGVLFVCSMSLFVTGLDVAILNLALPSVGREFSASVSGLQWAVDAYTLVLASLLVLSGTTADRIGRKRILTLGLSIFTLGSLLCSLAPTLGALVAFRMIQGVGASMLGPVALSIVTNTFTEARERAQAIGLWAAVYGASTALGPVVGGVLVSTLGWRAVFWINLPIGLGAIILTLRFVRESRAERARKPDAAGQVLLITLLSALTYAIIEAPRRGWGSTVVLCAFALAAVSLVVLVLWESRSTVEPLIDLRFFRSVPFAGATTIALASFGTMGGFLFLNSLYLQDVRGLSALHAGLDTLPMAAMAALLPPIAGRIVGTRGPRIPLVLAGLGLTISCAMLAQVNGRTSFTWLFTAYVLFGAGFGCVNAPITNAAVSGMPRSQAGMAGALASTSRQVGSTLGVAVVGALVAASAGVSSVSGVKGRPARLADGTPAAWWVLCGCGVCVLILAFVVTTSWARASAVRTARELNPEFLVGATP